MMKQLSDSGGSREGSEPQPAVELTKMSAVSREVQMVYLKLQQFDVGPRFPD